MSWRLSETHLAVVVLIQDPTLSGINVLVALVGASPA